VYYLEAALLEAMWKVLRIVRREELGRVEVGIRAIRETYHLVEPPPEAYIEAVEIYDRGHRDYIDALHYTTAKNLQIPLLTLDRKLIQFLKANSYLVEGIVLAPKELMKTLNNH
jgi:predicted nucleic acid-binding protein